MGRKKKGVLSKAYLQDKKNAKLACNKSEKLAQSPPQTLPALDVDSSNLHTAFENLTVSSTQLETSSTNDLINNLSSLQLGSEIEKSKYKDVETQTSHQMPLLDQILAHIALQNIILSIPSYAHPKVKKHLVEKYENHLNLSPISTEDMLKGLLHLDHEQVQKRVTEISKEMKSALGVFLLPPVSNCLLVINSL